MYVTMQSTKSIIEEPTAIVIAVLIAAIVLIMQNGSRKKKIEKTRVAFMKIKGRCIDKLAEYEEEMVNSLLGQTETKAYKELKELAVEFDQFCVDMEEDKFDKRALYDCFRGTITEHFRNIVELVTEEKESTDEFFEWYYSETDIHDIDEDGGFVKMVKDENGEE